MNKMVKKILFGFCFVVISSCMAQKNNKVMAQETFWVNEFKEVYFKRCLKHGFNNRSEINQILSQDKSNSGDFPLGIENYRFIDSMAKVTSKKIKQDSINHPWKKIPDSTGKRVFKYCLDDYTSKWLDSLAKTRLKK